MIRPFKFTSILLGISLFICGIFISCNGSDDTTQTSDENTQTEEPKDPGASDPFPWDFPKEAAIKTEVGDFVLSPHSFYESSIEKGKDLLKTAFIYYNAVVEEVGSTESKLKSVGKNYTVPNSLIIPIPKGQTAKKGDIVLSWWQKGSGMQRAIVTDDSNPSEPKVAYLDLSYKDDGSGVANKHEHQELKANSFFVLKDGEWAAGMPIRYKDKKDWKKGIILNVLDGKVLIMGFAGKMMAANQSDCRLLPLHQELKEGDEVYALFVAAYGDKTVKVIKVDQAIGRVWVENSFDDKKTDVLSVFDVVKSLD